MYFLLYFAVGPVELFSDTLLVAHLRYPSTHLCETARRLDLDAIFEGVPNVGWERMDVDTGSHEWHLMEEVCHQCTHPNTRARATAHADTDLKWRAR